MKDQFGDIDTEGKIIFKWIVKKQNVKVWTGFIYKVQWQTFVNTVMNLQAQ
jgi:hypothetical protein